MVALDVNMIPAAPLTLGDASTTGAHPHAAVLGRLAAHGAGRPPHLDGGGERLRVGLRRARGAGRRHKSSLRMIFIAAGSRKPRPTGSSRTPPSLVRTLS